MKTRIIAGILLTLGIIGLAHSCYERGRQSVFELYQQQSFVTVSTDAGTSCGWVQRYSLLACSQKIDLPTKPTSKILRFPVPEGTTSGRLMKIQKSEAPFPRW